MSVVAPSPDAIVVGSGLIGLSAGLALAEAGMRVTVIGEPRAGEASLAAAGLLAPSVEEVSAAYAFALASRDRYPGYIDWLFERSGFHVGLNRKGVLEVALDEQEQATLAANARQSGEWLSASALSELEPALRHAAGAFYYVDDGAVDNVALLRAIAAVIEKHPRVKRVMETVVAIDPGASSVSTGLSTLSARTIIIAAGAWTPGIAGLPRAIPVTPVRGQMISSSSAVVNRAAFGAGIYLVPRDTGWTVIGSTMERVGFDPTTTVRELTQLRHAATRLCPALEGSDMSEAWAGLRPVTPDLLPIIDRDPEFPQLIYACGHSRNGILMAPLTADCVAQLAVGERPAHDLSPFAITRFDGTASI
jgi:glycine oxidase